MDRMPLPRRVRTLAQGNTMLEILKMFLDRSVGIFSQYDYHFWGIGQLTIEGLTCRDRICPNDQSVPPNTTACIDPPDATQEVLFGRNGANAVLFNPVYWFDGAYTPTASEREIKSINWFQGDQTNNWVWEPVSNGDQPPTAGRSYCYSYADPTTGVEASFVGDGTNCKYQP